MATGISTTLASGKNDFYSVAIHELMHGIGIGTSDTWNSLTSGADWLGADAIAENSGSGVGLIDPGFSHIADGTMSPRLSDGALQEVVMGPSITIGTRKELTRLDLAFMRDLGLQTTPEPSSFSLFAMAIVYLGCLRQRGKERHAKHLSVAPTQKDQRR